MGEAAERLFMSPARLRTLTDNGGLPFFTAPNGRWRRFLRSDVEAKRREILSKRRVKPEPETIPFQEEPANETEELIEDYMRNRKKRYLTNPFDL